MTDQICALGAWSITGSLGRLGPEERQTLADPQAVVFRLRFEVAITSTPIELVTLTASIMSWLLL